MSKNETCACKASTNVVFHCQICKFLTERAKQETMTPIDRCVPDGKTGEEREVVIFVFQNESYRFNRKCGAVLVHGKHRFLKTMVTFSGRDGTQISRAKISSTP